MFKICLITPKKCEFAVAILNGKVFFYCVKEAVITECPFLQHKWPLLGFEPLTLCLL